MNKPLPPLLPEVVLIKPQVFRDPRGFFLETYHKTRYLSLGIPLDFVQDNTSYSARGVLRGLHYQKNYPQGKLVSVSVGAIFDVAVDLRPHSKTFGAWCAALLDHENHHQLYIPPGFAHGFYVLSDSARVHYKCTDYYHPEDERGIRWDDPRLAIAWPIPPGSMPLVSEKDTSYALLKRETQ